MDSLRGDMMFRAGNGLISLQQIMDIRQVRIDSSFPLSLDRRADDHGLLDVFKDRLAVNFQRSGNLSSGQSLPVKSLDMIDNVHG